MVVVLRQIQIRGHLLGPVTRWNLRVNTRRLRYDWPEKFTTQVALEWGPDHEHTSEQFIRRRRDLVSADLSGPKHHSSRSSQLCPS